MLGPLFLTAVIAGLGAAAPVDVLSMGGTFSIPQIPNADFVYNGPKEVLKTYLKYGKVPPQVVRRAAEPQSTGSVTATPADSFDSEYLCPVRIGSQTFQLAFDTGSSDLWVFSDKLPSAQRGSHALYTTSSTKQISGATWSIRYGDGSSSSGLVYRDSVTIGGVTFSSQAVEAATSAADQFVTGPSDGLVGLAFSSLNTVSPTKQKTFLDNITPTLRSPIMVADLKYKAAGSFDFGYIDSNKYNGSIYFSAVDNSQGFWGSTITRYQVGTTQVTGNVAVITDTGTSLVYLPTSIVQNYYSKVAGSQNSATYGGWVFPCKNTIPSFILTIGGFNATIPGKYINYAPVESTLTTCFGGIQDSTNLGVNLLGDVYIKSQYIVFDNTSGKPRIGLAVKRSV